MPSPQRKLWVKCDKKSTKPRQGRHVGKDAVIPMLDIQSQIKYLSLLPQLRNFADYSHSSRCGLGILRRYRG